MPSEPPYQAPRVKKSVAEWRLVLSKEQFRITRECGTEPAFSGVYHDCKESGLYRCVCCGAVLFRSEEKYDSGSGWPSFWRAAEAGALRLQRDGSLAMQRVEVLCANCDAHLGHVFEDGPNPTGKRYCINSAALDLDPENKPKSAG